MCSPNPMRARGSVQSFHARQADGEPHAPVRRTIQLTKGFVAIVDAADFDWLSRWSWTASVKATGVYAISTDEDGRVLYLHRLIFGASPQQLVDHIDRDTLNCSRSNLRDCTRAQNAWNRTGPQKAAGGFKGIWRRPSGRWSAQIAANGVKHPLGMYATPEEAAAAYDAAARRLHGAFAVLNFPEAA